MMEEMGFHSSPIKSEMKELADQVREHYPFHPKLAMQYFSLSYPTVIAATVVNLVWDYLEVETMMKAGIKFTRPIEKDDFLLLKSPFVLN